MLLVITTSKMFGKFTQEWHVGEPIPQSVYERVVTFQADGDELNLFIDAMLSTRAATNDTIWKKGTGFQPAAEQKKIYRIWYKLGPKFGTAVQIVPTGQTFDSQAKATLWIKFNPSFDGEWSVREENA